MRTGALNGLTALLTRQAAVSPRRLLLLLCIVVPTASAVLNNTPIVVLLIPILLTLGRRMNLAPSRLLLPVAYLATLGGTITLIGTSTNILVDGIWRDLGGPGLRIFDLAPIGIIYCAIGATYILITAPWLLPSRRPLGALTDNREGTTYISEVQITETSSIVGRPVEQVIRRVARNEQTASPVQVRHRRLSHPRRLDGPAAAPPGMELLELVRSGRIYRAEEASALLLTPGDILLISGTPSELAGFMRTSRSQPASVLDDDQRRPNLVAELPVVEAIVLPTSTVNGRYGNDLGLHHLYGVSILGAQHHGRRQFEGLRHLRLSPGDVLLLQGEREDLLACCEATGLLVMEGIESSIARGGKQWQALGIMASVILGASFTQIPIVTLALAGVVLMILFGALRPHEAFRSLDSTALLLLAGTIPLGAAMSETGLAQQIVDSIVASIGGVQPIVFVAAFFGITWILTELASNNAVAVLLTPVAVSLAASTGINPMALIMVVILGASASFTLPQGYQTNAMVMGPGGYRFVDYLRFGLPLSLICWVAATVLIPLFWPLTAP
jgi:di/tricarboxylate transporter